MQASLGENGPYIVGVMQTSLGKTSSKELGQSIEAALTGVKDELVGDMDLAVQLFEFTGPRLSPSDRGYSALSFVHMGMAEKLERGIHFLLIVTEAELAATRYSYTVAMPSQLANIGVISMQRLRPEFWGDAQNQETTVHRLAVAMLHTFGHLLNLPHRSERSNIMYDFQSVEELDRMGGFDAGQKETMRRILPQEARQEVGHDRPWLFALKQIVLDWRSILRAVLVANPLRLVTKLPTAITTGVSVAIVLFFSAEVWDVAGTVEVYQLILFAIISQLAATFMLYRAFAFGAVLNRRRAISESTVVIEAATLISILLAILILYIVFLAIWYIGAITVFPRKLMETWPTTDPAVKTLDHIKLSMFVAGMSVLAGSLGGQADSKQIVRSVLFLDEET